MHLVVAQRRVGPIDRRKAFRLEREMGRKPLQIAGFVDHAPADQHLIGTDL